MFKSLNERADRELLALIISGDENALKALYDRYFEELSRAAFKKLNDYQLVDEMIQDVFLNLWEKRASLDAEGDVLAYLFATLKYKALEEFRNRGKRFFHNEQFALQNPTHSETVEDDYLVKETMAQIKKAIANLPKRVQEAFFCPGLKT